MLAQMCAKEVDKLYSLTDDERSRPDSMSRPAGIQSFERGTASTPGRYSNDRFCVRRSSGLTNSLK